VTLAIIAPVTGQGSLVIVWLDLLLDLVVPVLVVVGLATLLRGRRAAAHTSLPSPAVVQPAATDSAPAGSSGSAATSLPSGQQLEPVWQPDEASGVAWHTAGDAALGVPAAGWGTPGEASGWQVIGDEENPSRADRPGPES